MIGARPEHDEHGDTWMEGCVALEMTGDTKKYENAKRAVKAYDGSTNTCDIKSNSALVNEFKSTLKAKQSMFDDNNREADGNLWFDKFFTTDQCNKWWKKGVGLNNGAKELPKYVSNDVPKKINYREAEKKLPYYYYHPEAKHWKDVPKPYDGPHEMIKGKACARGGRKGIFAKNGKSHSYCDRPKLSERNDNKVPWWSFETPRSPGETIMVMNQKKHSYMMEKPSLLSGKKATRK